MSDKLWLDEASDISPDEFDAVMRIPQRERKLEAENERLRKLVMFAYCEGYTEAGGWWEDGKWKNSESKQALKENTNE